MLMNMLIEDWCDFNANFEEQILLPYSYKVLFRKRRRWKNRIYGRNNMSYGGHLFLVFKLHGLGKQYDYNPDFSTLKNLVSFCNNSQTLVKILWDEVILFLISLFIMSDIIIQSLIQTCEENRLTPECYTTSRSPPNFSQGW